jgi:hypothetical protein
MERTARSNAIATVFQRPLDLACRVKINHQAPVKRRKMRKIWVSAVLFKSQHQNAMTAVVSKLSAIHDLSPCFFGGELSNGNDLALLKPSPYCRLLSGTCFHIA